MHANAADAAGTAVDGAFLVLAHGWRGGAGQNKRPAHASSPVNLMTGGVPDGRHALPLVDHMGALAEQHHRGVGAGEVEARVDV